MRNLRNLSHWTFVVNLGGEGVSRSENMAAGWRHFGSFWMPGAASTAASASGIAPG